MTGSLLVLGAMLLFLVGHETGRAQTGEQTLSRSEAVQIMRALNTAEADSIALSKHGLTMETVQEHRFVKQLDPQIGLSTRAGSDSALVKGHEVRLLLAQDQLHYTITIRSLGQSECPTIYMTNETGIMYTGVPASCEQH